MEDKCRRHIYNNIDRLISETEYKSLLTKCIEKGMLTQVMAANVDNVPYTHEMSKDEMERERHRRLFRKLTKRGPTAYRHLKTILSELCFDDAVRLLNEICLDDSQFKSLSQGNQLKQLRIPEDERDLPQRLLLTPTISNYNNNNSNYINNSNNNNNTNSEIHENRLKNLQLSETENVLEPIINTIEPKVPHEVIKASSIKVDSKVTSYPMDSHNNRGVFFMVNIIDFPDKQQHRAGAEEDGNSLLHLFKNFDFKLFAFENLTKKTFFEKLEMLLKSKYTRDTQCFVMALMTHGNINSNGMQCVEFHDGSIVDVAQIEHYFGNAPCPNLVGKPKILLFPFCRGDLPDYGTRVQTDGIASRPSNMRVTHSISDVMICYASSMGFKSHRDTTLGSWYIQKFCELMAQHAHDTHFEDIIKMVQAETATLRTTQGAMQMGTYENRGFNRTLYFNPGIYRIEDGNP